MRDGSRFYYHFYPRPPCGGRHYAYRWFNDFTEFLSTSPLRGTTSESSHQAFMLFISIHVPLAGDDGPHAGGGGGNIISIHVPLAGDDNIRNIDRDIPDNFYPRPPCGGRRGPHAGGGGGNIISIHVPLAGDDRQRQGAATGRLEDFYPRPPCGGRQRAVRDARLHEDFYPRPPCGGRHPAALVTASSG